MIMRNERALLPRCLGSVAGVVDEVVIVDTGSEDDSVAVARGLGARVVESAWHQDFSRARNLALYHARGRWVLCLDADEFLCERDRGRLRPMLERVTPADDAWPGMAFNVVVCNSADGGNTGHSAYIARLFPNRPDVRFEWPVHEQVVTSLGGAGIGIENCDITLVHTGYNDRAINRRKQERNRALLLGQIRAAGEVAPLTYFFLAGAQLDLGEHEQALAGYADCSKRAGGDPELARAATVRMATCLLALGRPAEVLALMPAEEETAWHPELRYYRAEAVCAIHGPEAAREFYEAVLDCPNRPEVPTCNVGGLKIAALKFLGGYWKDRGEPERGVRLLRRALSITREGRDFTRSDLDRVD